MLMKTPRMRMKLGKNCVTGNKKRCVFVRQHSKTFVHLSYSIALQLDKCKRGNFLFPSFDELHQLDDEQRSERAKADCNSGASFASCAFN